MIGTVSEDNQSIVDQLRRFVAQRNWAQFHTPKNLSMALMVEAAELMEHFQWLTAEESKSLTPEQEAEVADEIADVQIYLTMLADRLGIDIAAAIQAKIRKNAAKYPANAADGAADLK